MKGFYRIIAVVVLALSGVGAMAQTEITSDMIWREGTTWTEVRVNTLRKTYTRGEYSLVPVEYGGEQRLTVKELSFYCGSYAPGNLSCDGAHYKYPIGTTLQPYIRLVDNRVYVRMPCLDKELVMYDFNTWNDNGVARYEYVTNADSGDGYVLADRSESVNTMTEMYIDPDNRFVGNVYVKADINVTNIKGIGRLNDFYGLVCCYDLPRFSNGDGGVDVIEVKTPELGVVYRHPNYSEYDKYVGVEAIEAGVGEPEILVSGDAVTVTSEAEVDVLVYTVTGMEVRRGVCLGSLNVPLNPGLYIVRAGTVTRKVRI